MGAFKALTCATLLLLFGCNYRNDKMALPLSGEANFQSVQRFILEPKCVGCHNSDMSPSGVNLTSYESALIWIAPFKPEESQLFISVASGRMPKGNPLNPSEVALIHTWIASGAKKESP